MKSKILYLHIGTEKTGTKSIQNFLSTNAELLQEDGFYVADFLGEAHRKVTGIAFNHYSKDDLFITECQDSESTQEKVEYIEKVRAEFSNHAISTTYPKWIISSEFLQARLQTKEEVERLRTFLSAFFNKIYVVLYIRNQADAACSLWSTAVSSGLAWTLFPEPSEVSYAFDHRRTIQLWSSIFSEDVCVRLFDSDQFVGGALINDFCYATSINLNDKYAIPPRQNESLPYLGIKTLAYINKNIPYFIDGKINPLRHKLIEQVSEYFRKIDPSPTIIENSIRKKYYDFYNKSNEWVKENYFKDKTQLFNYFPVCAADLNNFYSSERLYQIYSDLISLIYKRDSA
ncbi:hypothetical protein KZZ10_10270 [Alcaligenaceae bacterium LF4-65]|uniref:Uncharacterized protein n=1 Tax=Zwartia hollandica TaxID=324606 RepID=A0A953NCY3_9BURK|nr:hypothetical protein [Zwartia hollandica]MBZ1351030.1 hypothetical protein [Zwartia hollandica]